MDRFIEYSDYAGDYEFRILKSNMDRFIVHIRFYK